MTQVAVIGCGIVGAAIAYELSRVPGLAIALLDRKAPACGSTGAALGVLMGAVSQKVKGRAWRLREVSLQRYETLIPELEALTGTPIPFNRQGILKLCFATEDLVRGERLSAIRRSQGWPLEIWNLARLQANCPQLHDDRIVGAVYSPRDRQVNPTLLTRALVAGAAQNGVDCQFGVSVDAIATESAPSNQRRCYRLQTTAGELAVDWLVISAGLGSTPLTASLARPLDIRPVLGQALHLKLQHPLGNPDFQPVVTGDDVHIVPVGRDEYWVGATLEFPGDKNNEVEADPVLLEKVKQAAIAFCPALANATILRTWSGKRPRPEGHPAPIVGKLPGYDNVLLATGHYRNGVLLAPATARIIREVISSDTPSISG